VRYTLIKYLLGIVAFAPHPTFASEQCDGLKAVGGSCDASTLTGQVQTIISTLFIVAGAVAVIIMIMGGIRYITSTGDGKRVQAAKDTILYAVIGLVVVILGRAIVGFVIGQIS